MLNFGKVCAATNMAYFDQNEAITIIIENHTLDKRFQVNRQSIGSYSYICRRPIVARDRYRWVLFVAY